MAAHRRGRLARALEGDRVEDRPVLGEGTLGAVRLACSSRPPKNCSARSPPASMPRMYGCTIAVSPSACMRSSCRTALSCCSGVYRAAYRAPAPDVGLTTYSWSGGRSAGSPGARYRVGTTGTPASASSPMYRLSVFQRTTSTGFASRVTLAHRSAHATNSAARQL